MTALIVILGTVLPLLPLLLSPARAIGRGGALKYVGAAGLVGIMLLLFFSLRDVTGDGGTGPEGDAALPSISDTDVSALEKLLAGG